MHYCYIIYSPTLDSFYTGESVDVHTRLLQHNNRTFFNAYTEKAKDWELFLKIDCKDRIQARKIERFIKKQKSKKFIRLLKENPNTVQDLLNKL